MTVCPKGLVLFLYFFSALEQGGIWWLQIDGLVQNCSISSANALEILQFCTKPLRYSVVEQGYLFSLSLFHSQWSFSYAAS